MNPIYRTSIKVFIWVVILFLSNSSLHGQEKKGSFILQHEVTKAQASSKNTVDAAGYFLRQSANPPANSMNAPFDLQLSFDLQAITGANGNAGAEFDGTYFYSTRWAADSLHKYDISGTLVERFVVPGVTGLRDLAFDGTYMYGGDAGNVIYQMDFNTKTLVSTIPSPVAVRHIAYDPGADGFWVGTWADSPTLIDRSGATIDVLNTGLTTQYGSAYDNYSAGGPYLWVFNQGSGAGFPQLIHQFDLNTGNATGLTYDVTTDFPATAGIAGGLWIGEGVVPGTASIGGVLQGSPDMFFVYELEAPNISVSPGSLNVELSVGQTTTRNLTITNNNGLRLDYSIYLESNKDGPKVSFFAEESIQDHRIVAVGKPVPLSALKDQVQSTIAFGDIPDSQMPFNISSIRKGYTPVLEGEEIFGSNQNVFGPSGTRGRGNLFTCTTSTTLIEHRLYLNLPVATTVWFTVYEGDAQVGDYNLVSASNVTPQGPGEGWYSSGPVYVPMIAGKYYCILAQWQAPANYYNEQNIAPYPIPASFGELTAGAGWNWAPTYSDPPFLTQSVPAGAFGEPVAYYQAIITDVSIPWLSANPIFGFLEAYDSEDITVIFDATGLTPDTYTADIVVRSTDPDQPEWQIPVSMLVGAPPVPPSPEEPADGASEIPTSTTLRWRSSGSASSYTLQVALSSSFSSSTMIFDQEITDTTQTLTGLAENTTYHWRVNAKNNFGTSDWTQSSFTTVSTIDLSHTVSYPSHANPKDFSSNEYRIVGLPGQSNLAVGTVLSGTHGTDWTAYWDDGSPTDYLKQFDNSAIFQFSIGRAFWIIRKGDLNINQMVTAAPLNDSGMVIIPLNSGDWTLITNPFPVPVEWSEILNTNGITNNPPLYKFDGSFTPVDTTESIQPHIGYLFDHETIGLSSLDIPYPHGSSIPLSSEILDPVLWRVRIELSNGKNADKTTSLGISEEANLERDHLDFHKPRGFYQGPTVFFKRPEWDLDFSSFATDIRPPFAELENWEFEVRSQTGSKLTLTFSGIEEIPSQFEVYLIDETAARFINLREELSYQFTSIKPVSHFKVVVGKEGIVKETLDSVIPREFGLGVNYPNPFNPSTVIPVDIPSTTEVELVIYNILGKKVKTLYSGSLEPGRHGFRWDGRDTGGTKVASGVYLYRFTTRTGISRTKKMILLK